MIGKSFDAFTGELDSLAAAAREAELELPVLGPHIGPLEAKLEQLREAKARQQAHAAERRDATQELHEGLTAAQDLAIQLRSVVRAELGPRDPRLAQFGVHVLKPRKPRKASPEESAPMATAARRKTR